MAEEMNSPVLPQTDSIRDLARFWDTHDLADFETELEEVVEPVFERGASLTIRLESSQIDAVNDIAKSHGLDSADLIQRWVRGKNSIFVIRRTACKRGRGGT